MKSNRQPLQLSEPSDLSWMTHHDFQTFSRQVRLALGTVLRAIREEREWSRGEMVSMMPSHISERAVLSYEHGRRGVTEIRWIEMCVVLGVSPGVFLDYALQKARVALDTVVLRVDLQKVIDTRDPQSRPLGQWARNRLKDTPGGVVVMHPIGVRELAAALGYELADLQTRLSTFAPLLVLPDAPEPGSPA